MQCQFTEPIYVYDEGSNWNLRSTICNKLCDTDMPISHIKRVYANVEQEFFYFGFIRRDFIADEHLTIRLH